MKNLNTTNVRLLYHHYSFNVTCQHFVYITTYYHFQPLKLILFIFFLSLCWLILFFRNIPSRHKITYQSISFVFLVHIYDLCINSHYRAIYISINVKLAKRLLLFCSVHYNTFVVLNVNIKFVWSRAWIIFVTPCKKTIMKC